MHRACICFSNKTSYKEFIQIKKELNKKRKWDLALNGLSLRFIKTTVIKLFILHKSLYEFKIKVSKFGPHSAGALKLSVCPSVRPFKISRPEQISHFGPIWLIPNP